MASTLVHLALGALLAAGLLGEEFDARALGVVLVATAFPDLDTFIGIVLPGTHRALLHTALVPLGLAVLVLYDTRSRESPWLASPRAVRLAWVGVAAYALAGIGPDLFTNGVNVLYPIYDQFISLSGRVWLTDQRGLVQTIWEVQESTRGTTETTHYATGVDTARGADPPDKERIFPLVDTGFQLLLVLSAVVVTTGRFWSARKA
jgi:hypothetical protein